MNDNDYVSYIKKNKKHTDEYYRKSINKTEQQKFIENYLLSELKLDLNKKYTIADIACGYGTCTYHLSRIFKYSNFILLDLNDDAIANAKKINSDIDAKYFVESCYDMKSISDNSVDMAFCLQTLAWITQPDLCIKEMVRITKPGGHIFITSLFNLDYDCDLIVKVRDYTKDSDTLINYNTYCEFTIKSWIENLSIKNYKLKKFEIGIDLPKKTRGLGTHTVKTEKGEVIQISGGYLMNWGLLHIIK